MDYIIECLELAYVARSCYGYRGLINAKEIAGLLQNLSYIDLWSAGVAVQMRSLSVM